MKKSLIFAVCFAVLALLTAMCVSAEDGGEKILDEYTEMYGAELEKAVSALETADIEKAVPGFSVSEILSSAVKGGEVFSIRGVLERAVELFAGEVRDTVRLMLIIAVLAVMTGYLANLRTAFGGAGADDAAFFVCYAVTAGIAAAAFADVIGCAEQALKNITLFMQVIVPLMLAGTAASGAAVTATAFEGLLIAVIEITQWSIVSVFVPLLLTAAGINIVNNLSNGLKADKMAELLNKSVKWGLGIMLTIFVGVTGLRGIAAGSVDGLTVKVTKFAASNLIPVVGGILAETVETVMNCSAAIKNAVGAAGIVTVTLIVAVPLIKIAACLLIFRLSAAIVQPVADERTVKCISELADSIACVFAMLAAVSVMFIIMLTLMISMGNSALNFGR